MMRLKRQENEGANLGAIFFFKFVFSLPCLPSLTGLRVFGHGMDAESRPCGAQACHHPCSVPQCLGARPMTASPEMFGLKRSGPFFSFSPFGCPYPSSDTVQPLWLAELSKVPGIVAAAVEPLRFGCRWPLVVH